LGGWGCTYESQGKCRRLGGKICDPGLKGCILHGRFRFSNPDKNKEHPKEAPDKPIKKREAAK
jgi:hypothetical protein